jgi:microcompartment protein CcmK/EutM
MNLARVVGRVVSSHKDPGLSGSKLLLLQPVGPALDDRGTPVLAADAVGAGAGEIVIYVKGREAAYAFLPETVPTDAGIIGIVDDIHVDAAAGSPAPGPKGAA